MGHRVTVIIPTFNRAGFITQAIDSVLAQTQPVAQIIVVDDGSTDDTQRVLQQYGDRLQYIRQENAGAAVARNTGIAAAQNELIALLDSDDRWLPNKLAAQLPLFDDPSIGLVYGGFRCFDSSGTITHEQFSGHDLNVHDLLAFTPLGTQTLIFRREAALEIGGFDPACCPAEDQDFTLRLAAHHRIAGVEQVVVEIRQHDQQISDNKEKLFRASMHVLRKHRHLHHHCLACRRAYVRGKRRIGRFLYHDLYRRARREWAQGHTLRALRMGFRALSVYPSAILMIPGWLLE